MMKLQASINMFVSVRNKHVRLLLEILISYRNTKFLRAKETFTNNISFFVRHNDQMFNDPPVMQFMAHTLRTAIVWVLRADLTIERYPPTDNEFRPLWYYIPPVPENRRSCNYFACITNISLTLNHSTEQAIASISNELSCKVWTILFF